MKINYLNTELSVEQIKSIESDIIDYIKSHKSEYQEFLQDIK